MALLRRPVLILLLLLTASVVRCQEQAQTTDWRATLKTIRNGVHKIDTYLNAAADLLGGEDGLCQYDCSDGSKPLPRCCSNPPHRMDVALHCLKQSDLEEKGRRLELTPPSSYAPVYKEKEDSLTSVDGERAEALEQGTHNTFPWHEILGN
ncbi:hypothetical protein P7K49_036205 [Saguinus oedipus]|uniref:Uncharacterized protein n=1 Tax=Saguinus oedipus TaxID=9490 RepID=A0ABQ9TJG0_SAGOE|nr:hypothetical protein P7K49_036205 [Saguinus oedipus]